MPALPILISSYKPRKQRSKDPLRFRLLHELGEPEAVLKTQKFVVWPDVAPIQEAGNNNKSETAWWVGGPEAKKGLGSDFF
jgi:hypothetical protein